MTYDLSYLSIVIYELLCFSSLFLFFYCSKKAFYCQADYTKIPKLSIEKFGGVWIVVAKFTPLKCFSSHKGNGKKAPNLKNTPCFNKKIFYGVYLAFCFAQVRPVPKWFRASSAITLSTVFATPHTNALVWGKFRHYEKFGLKIKR